MKKQWLSLVVAMFFVVGLPFVMFVDTASAQVDCTKFPEKCPPPKGTPCSPGYWKNHLDAWYNHPDICDSIQGALPDCVALLNALTCKGSDASCHRSDAAAYLNFMTGCTE